ncbi:uncharacterized protein EKO05_0008018 [Ascochyta rabiei]|uniref:uncharacterized protein n=1 Tax=Didymella rabiei TaxID=5454 RepID=UPI00220BC0AD|nr:uncharacterized protein EKO05_0008018 [Ascochyta rabiei]UPX17677.1 hypothetical protein EKO05_0008018 [Ascochyta rabiei]
MAEQAAQPPHIHRPIPRRNLDSRSHRDTPESPTHASSPPASNLQNSRSSDFLAQLNARLLGTYHSRTDDAPDSPNDGTGSARLPRQNKSFLNMNSSTLFGIYDDIGASTNGAQSVADTPWGTGAETPGHAAMGWNGGLYDGTSGAEAALSMKEKARRASGNGKLQAERRRSSSTRRARGGVAKYAILFFKLAALFMFGILYGLIVSHLHDTRQLAAVHVAGVNRESWVYVSIWGCAGVALGSLLPYMDLLWSRHHASDDPDEKAQDDKEADPPISEQIHDVVRSVAAFLGVAFAIRRLPWQSTLQLTLTLALVNPALWYILDRSKPGLSFSLIVTSVLTSLIFLSNPTALPSPSGIAVGNVTSADSARRQQQQQQQQQQHLFVGLISYNTLAVVTWVGSVLFCSCVCFGSIGRRLAVLEKR